MAKEFKMVISPDGEVVTSVYNEHLDVSQIGTPKINRATEVCYNNIEGFWEVIALKPLFAVERVLTNDFKSRAEALDWEIAFLNTNMIEIINDANTRSCGSRAQA